MEPSLTTSLLGLDFSMFLETAIDRWYVQTSQSPYHLGLNENWSGKLSYSVWIKIIPATSHHSNPHVFFCHLRLDCTAFYLDVPRPLTPKQLGIVPGFEPIFPQWWAILSLWIGSRSTSKGIWFSTTKITYRQHVYRFHNWPGQAKLNAEVDEKSQRLNGFHEQCELLIKATARWGLRRVPKVVRSDNLSAYQPNEGHESGAEGPRSVAVVSLALRSQKLGHAGQLSRFCHL